MPRALSMIVGAVLTGLWLTGAHAEEPAVGDERVLPRHLDLDDIAAGRIPLDQVIKLGRTLFDARFTLEDGAGRPGATQAIVPTRRPPGNRPTFFRTAGPDASSCLGCHNQPSSGGAGDFVANVFVSEGFADAEFDSLDPQFSNERGSPAMNGDGLVELLAREMTRDLQAIRARAAAAARRDGHPVTAALTSKGVSFGTVTVDQAGFVDVSGITGIDHDLIVRPFSQKGVFTSLRQFTINALNQHSGMEADERFGARWTGTDDFDGDGVAHEISAGDVTALVAFQAALPMPVQVLPADPARHAAAERGETLFTGIGCGGCHVPALPLDSALFTDPGPYDAAGTLNSAGVAKPLVIDLARLPWAAGLARDSEGRLLVPVYGDLKRHRIADEAQPYYANELLSQRFVGRDEFLAARLWGVGSTAPYGHRGDVTTLNQAIRYHGGEATSVRRAYEALPEPDRRAIVEFLKSLRILPAVPG